MGSLKLRMMRALLPGLCAEGPWYMLWRRKSQTGKYLVSNFHHTPQWSASEDKSEVRQAREAAASKALSQEPTVFSKILSKEIPADIIHEDDKVTFWKTCLLLELSHELLVLV